jgi:hypothetical protein
MAETTAGVREELRALRFTMFSGSVLEGAAGAGALVLSILGLVGILTYYMLGIATILIGAALIMEGSAVSARMAQTLHEATGGKIEMAELGGGVSVEFLGGVAGIGLGIVGLADVVPYVLWPIAAITFGCAHVLGSAVTAHIRQTRYLGESEHIQRIAVGIIRSAADVQALIGIGGAVLGILALIGLAPTILTLIAMLGFGFADLLRGPAITFRTITRTY